MNTEISQRSNRLIALQVKLAETEGWTNRDHWKHLTLSNKENLRYAVTLTMKQSFKVTEGPYIFWEPLDAYKAAAELRYLRNRLNEEIYGKKWFKRLQGRKPNGLSFVPVIQGKQGGDLNLFWNDTNCAKTSSDYFDEDGVIHAGKRVSSRKRHQNLHYHCFIDRDLSCAWNNEIKEMVEVRDLSEMTKMIQMIWNEADYGEGITKIDVQDIWNHPLKHEGWSDYISREEFKDCEGYDGNNLILY